MKNWLGQEFIEGAIVGRGARDGNTSSFKIGRVIGFDEARGAVKVHWLYEPPWSGGRRAITRMDGKPSIGAPHVDTLFLLDPDTFDYALDSALLLEGGDSND